MRLIHLFLLAALTAACTGDLKRGPDTPGVIRIGVLPDQSMARLLAQYTPLQNYLRDKLATDVELVVAAGGYAEMLDDFHAGRLHIANLGGLTFVQAESRSGAVPLVMRDTDLNFTSCFIADAESDGRSIADYEGEAFSFGPELSTSGHLMPRRYMHVTGFDPESFFSSVVYSSGHDATVEMVRTGEVTVGAANCVIVRSMLESSDNVTGDVRIIATTPAYANYVWAVQKNLDEEIKLALRDAFMALDPSVAAHERVLNALGAHGYVPAGRNDFQDVRQAARDYGLLDSPDGE